MLNSFAIFVALSTFLIGCATTDSSEAPGPSAPSAILQTGWQSELYADHPLVGKIWDTDANVFIGENELFAAITRSRYFLLGEKHDNPDHHFLQLEILNRLISSNSLASVSLEMIDSSADERLETVGPQNFDTLDALKSHLDWDEEGWEWPFYGPLIMATLSAEIPVYSANISNQQMGEIYGQPLDPAIATVLDASAIDQLNAEIDASHCNMLPASQFPAMVGIQQARDHQMARSLVHGSAGESTNLKTSLLFAGNYHIRQDLSVPNYIMALDATITRSQIVSLAILEVDPESDDPIEYMQAFSSTAPFDYIWFTPAISDEDYCAGLRQQN